MNRNESTLRSFSNSYNNHQTISPTRGRPIEINEDTKQSVTGFMLAEPTQSLFNVAQDFDISTVSVRTILHQNKIQYFDKTPMVELKEYHKRARVNMCRQISTINYRNLPPIVFTDESTVRVDLKGGGIWRQRGFHPPESFYIKNPHPVQIMVWGGISHLGYKTKLIKFETHVNSFTYCKALKENFIFESLFGRYGQNFIWQQDNATPHTAALTQDYLDQKVKYILEWPAKSPDLSPIEQVWDYIKKKLSGQNFDTPDALFNAIEKVWNEIPPFLIHHYYSSFYARFKICLKYNGDSLNGHWNEVRKLHMEYQTCLQEITNPLTGLKYFIEI